MRCVFGGNGRPCTAVRLVVVRIAKYRSANESNLGMQNINVIFMRLTQYSCVMLLYITETTQGIGYKKGKGGMSGRFGSGISKKFLLRE